MSENIINWSDLHKNATTVLEGEFPVVVTETTVTAAATSGKPMIKTKLRVETGTYAGRTLFHNFNITADNDNAMRIFFGQMSVLGLDAAFWQANPSATVDQIAAALVGRKAVAVVGGREWQGSMREEIKNWKPALGGPGSGPAILGGPLSIPAPSGPIGGNPSARYGAPGTPPPTPTVAEPSTPPPSDPF